MKKIVRIFLMMMFSSLIFMSQVTAQTILCVDRDGSDTSADSFTDTWPAISRALDAAGYTYDYIDVDPAGNGPNLTTMGEYDVVIWFTGEAWANQETMTPEDEAAILLYTALGGKLFLNSQDYLWDRYPSAGTFDEGEFPREQFGIVEVVQDIYTYKVLEPPDTARFVGSPGSLAEGLSFPVRDIFTTPDDEGLYGDSIAQHLGQDLLGILGPYNSPGPAAIQYETEYFRSVFSTIDIAAITDTVARDVFMHRIVDWLMYGPTGVNELKPNDIQLVIKPNPVADFVNIGMTTTMEEVSVFNSQGQMVHFEKINKSSIRMDMSNLPGGMYILKIKTAEGIITDKILKH